MSPWLFIAYMDAVMKDVKMEMRRMGVRFKRMEESGDCVASCMQMSWFCVVRWRKT